MPAGLGMAATGEGAGRADLVGEQPDLHGCCRRDAGEAAAAVADRTSPRAPELVGHAQRRRLAREPEPLEPGGCLFDLVAGGKPARGGDVVPGAGQLTAAEVRTHPHGFGPGCPGVAAERLEPSCRTGGDGARPEGVVCKERPCQVVLRLGPGLRHPLPSEDGRRLGQGPLGLHGVARIPQHFGAVHVAYCGEDGRDVHEGRPRGRHVAHGGDEVAAEQGQIALVVQRLRPRRSVGRAHRRSARPARHRARRRSTAGGAYRRGCG